MEINEIITNPHFVEDVDRFLDEGLDLDLVDDTHQLDQVVYDYLSVVFTDLTSFELRRTLQIWRAHSNIRPMFELIEETT